MRSFFLALAVIAWLVPIPAAKNHSEETPNGQELQRNETGKSNPFPPSVIIQNISNSQPSEPKGDHQTNNGHNRAHDWIDILNASSTAVIAVFTILLFCGIIIQIRNSRNSERAWVLVEKVGNPAENWRSTANPSYIPGIIFEFKVYGNTLARIIDGRFDLNWFPQKRGQPRPTPDLPEIPDYSKALKLPNVSEEGIPWAPGGTYEVHRICSLDQNKKEMLANGDIVFCGYGYLQYIDVFGKKRETRTCYIYYIQHGGVMKGPDGIVLNPDGFYMGGPPAYNRAT